jgi:hypothetical protein
LYQKLEIERRKALFDAQMAALRADFEAEKSDLELEIAKEKQRQEILAQGVAALAKGRRADQIAPKTAKVGKTGKGVNK